MPSQTILVVDDDAAVLDFCCSVLSQYGYHVLGAASGQEALQVYGQGDRFDMALVDVMMPGMNGIELAKRLKALESGMKVALTSGHSPDEVSRLIGEDGSSYRIFWKPYDLRIFLQMIHNVLDAPQRVTVAFARS
jgi:CheY-like chemotaxis protein